MLISVVIPTYNRAELIREALNSVFAQTYKEIEVIVVDDGGTDHTDKVLADYGDRVKTIRLDRSGIGAARNAGVDAASGEFIAFLDNDDLWLPEKLEKQVQFATTHPEMMVTYTDAVQFREEGDEAKSFVDRFPDLRDPANLFTPMILKRAIPLMSTTMIRTSFLRSNHLRFPKYLGLDDLALFLESMIEGGKFGYLPEPLTRRRMHDSNFSGNHRRRIEQRFLLYTEMLEQCRARCTPQMVTALVLGVRDTRYRMGECYWEDLNLRKARSEFFHAVTPDARGMKSLAYCLMTILPSRLIAAMRRSKGVVQPRKSDTSSPKR